MQSHPSAAASLMYSPPPNDTAWGSKYYCKVLETAENARLLNDQGKYKIFYFLQQ